MIIVDVHEPRLIIEFLKERGTEVLIKAISPGDYIIGDIGIERKSLNDFYMSIIKKRLFEQLSRLKDVYSRHILIVEGDLAEVSSFKNPNVFWGAFLSITFDMDVPIIFTPNMEETANLLATIDKRLAKEKKPISLRYKPKILTEDEWKIFIVQGLPQIGPKLAEELLKRFGNVRRIFNATVAELTSIPEIGEKRARRIVRIITSKYGAGKKPYILGE
ncbi:hypothetical protein DRN86_00720 [Candidatus Geothermarchaeota archaeon]|nr:MAG: hypothetical protein DRN86_00720 [Candidatus Geothermarchaeota archaeon]